MMASTPLALECLRRWMCCAAVRLGLIKPPPPPAEIPWVAAARKVEELLVMFQEKK